MATRLRTQIARLELLARAHPDSRVVLHLAEAHRRAGELEKARRVLERGLARRPEDAAARVLLGRVLLDLGRWAEAQEAFRAALAGRPEHMEVVALRALGELAALWRTDAALGAGGAAAAAAAPAEADVDAHAAQERPSRDARATASAALLDDLPWEEMTMVTETLAELYAAQGLTGQAAALYRELLAARPGDPRILARLRELTGERAGESGTPPADAASGSRPEAPAGDAAPAHARPAAAGLDITFLRMSGQPPEQPVRQARADLPEPEPHGHALPEAEPPEPALPALAPDAIAMPQTESQLPPPEPEPLVGSRPGEAAPTDDFDWLFSPTAPPGDAGASIGADAWAHLVTLADLALDTLAEVPQPGAVAARHVRRLVREGGRELGLDGAALSALELAAQLLGIAEPAGEAPDAWVAAALARVETLELPAVTLEVLHGAATLAAADDGARSVPLASRVLVAAVAFRAELARRRPPGPHALREAGAALWQNAGRTCGRDVVAALLGVVARDPGLAFPLEHRVLVVGSDDGAATSIAQAFRAVGDRVGRARSIDAAHAMLLDAGDCAAVVLLPDVGTDRAAYLVRELRHTLRHARPVVVATGIADAHGRAALLRAGADLCLAPGADAAEVHAAAEALLRRLRDARETAASAPEPGARTGVRSQDDSASP